MILNKDLKIIDCNETSLKRIGYSFEKLKDQSALFFISEEDRGEISEGIDEAIEGESALIEGKLATKSGEKIPHSWSFTPVRNEENDIARTICVGRDITSRKKAEEREELLHSILRHDLGNKAQIVQGYHELLKGCDLSKDARGYPEKASKTVEVSLDLIEKVRTLREIDKKKNFGKINLEDMMKQVAIENEPQASEKGIEIECEIIDSLIRGGPLLKELFSNILENAIVHSNCSKIMISSEVTDENCIVSFDDDGKGIPDEDKERIFERGFKKGEKAGSGLGLFLSREIVESYGGNINVEDSKLGGARFDIHLERP